MVAKYVQKFSFFKDPSSAHFWSFNSKGFFELLETSIIICSVGENMEKTDWEGRQSNMFFSSREEIKHGFYLLFYR